MKTVNTHGSLPMTAHYAVLVYSRICIPSDDPSYKADEWKDIVEYISFNNSQELSDWIVKEERKNPRMYSVINVTPINPKITISVKLD